jgi:tripartite-type tricarboxylate transporter receptor subunit TctC
MSRSRRQFMRLALGVATLSGIPSVVSAQPYPTKPVRLIVPVAPGGNLDLHARLIGQSLSERIGQPVVIENRPGAGGNIGTESVVRAPADGYTLLLIPAAATINASLFEKLNFNFIRDIAPVAAISRVPLVMAVNASVPATTLVEFIAFAKANPGKLSVASGGVGSVAHLAAELLKMMAGIEMAHVPYRGGAPALTDVMAGQVQVIFSPLPEVLEIIRADKLRPLAVTTALRSEALPQLPTVGDVVHGYEASTWNGIGAPANTPTEIINQLNTAINAGLNDPAIKARLSDLGSSALVITPAEFARLIATEAEKWGKVIKAVGVKTVN